MAVSYCAIKPEAAFSELQTSKEGISAQEAESRLLKYGFNELEKEKKISLWKIFFSQFKDILVILLLVAGILSLISGEFLEAGAIFFMLLLNSILGLIQEYKAERALEALRKVSAPSAKVIRNGIVLKIPAAQVVPGDIIILEAGDIVPADARLFEAQSLRIDESALTGESVASGKDLEIYKENISVADQKNMVFSSTIVTYGKGKAVVVATGTNTEFGKIAKAIETTKEDMTPLQRKFAMLSKQLGIITLILVAIVLAMGLWDGVPLIVMAFFCLALIVSTVPDSLPVVVTVGLSLGANRLARKNMLVKKLSAAESLGSATVICTDKTGTLTKNQMTITDLCIDDKIITVTGAGYDIRGELHDQQAGAKPYDTKKLEMFLRIGVLCNDAELTHNALENRYEIIGDPTEGSLLVLARKAGLQEDKMHDKYVLVRDLPFDSDRKCMTAIYQEKIQGKAKSSETSMGKPIAYVKGATDLLLHKCDRLLENGKVRKLTAKDKARILARNEEFATRALRVLALAYRELPTTKKPEKDYTITSVERNLIYVGLVGMIDPPRDEVPIAVRKCHEAGIKVIMITGDHAITARAIAQQIGLWSDRSIAITGEELEKLSDVELQARIEDIAIVARALPLQKVRIVDALKQHGHIVAMTGDGVNDAPALKRADIGIAMGSGTDVAKEVAKGTLVDDNFSSIVNAIEEGRNVYDKIIKSARYLLACNTGEIVAVFIALMMAFPLPLLPLQLLLMNILTDDFPAIGLGTEPPDEGVMQRLPRKPDAKPLDLRMVAMIVIFGLIMGLSTMYVFMKYKDVDLPRAQTMAFTLLVFIEMFAAISSRSLYPSIKKLNPFTNWRLLFAIVLSVAIQLAVIYMPLLQSIFQTVALSGADWMLLLELSLYGLIGMEIFKGILWFMDRKKNVVRLTQNT